MWRIRMETYDEIDLRQKELDVSVRSLRKTATAYANAERNYKKALRQKALELRDGGMPVTLIDKVIYGEEEVANLRFERDVAEAVYKANQESINVLKLNLRILEGTLNREWGQAK